MSILQNLVDFYMASVSNRVLMVLLFWLIWPGGMFLVGLVFESRIVPIGERQSIAFWPGDLSLGVMLVAIIGMYANFDKVPLVRSWLYWLVLIIAMALLAYKLRSDDISHYPPRSRVSPTKITHDVMGYFVAPTLLVGFGLPQFLAILLMITYSMNWPSWLIFMMCGAFYLLCARADAEAGYTTDDILARHPEDWAPIWKTCKIKVRTRRR